MRFLPADRHGAALALALVLLVAGCGGDDSPVVRPPESPSDSVSTPPSKSPTPTPTSSPDAPAISVEPAARLRDGQTVSVRASGFSPGLSLIVVECAQKGEATGPGDCNLDASVMVTTDATGAARAQLDVAKGPFGANGVVCGPEVACLVSVSEATFDPSEEADRPISFR